MSIGKKSLMNDSVRRRHFKTIMKSTLTCFAITENNALFTALFFNIKYVTMSDVYSIVEREVFYRTGKEPILQNTSTL